MKNERPKVDYNLSYEGLRNLNMPLNQVNELRIAHSLEHIAGYLGEINKKLDKVMEDRN